MICFKIQIMMHSHQQLHVGTAQYIPSFVGIAGKWKLKMNDRDQSINLEISDDCVKYKDLNIPLDFVERELRDEDEEKKTFFMRIVAYVPDTEWRNGDPSFEKIELCGTCDYDNIIGVFKLNTDELNATYQKDNEQILSTEAVRYRYSDKISQLAQNAQSFKGGNEVYDTESECLVCMEAYDNDKHMAMISPCGHVWCSSCIVAVFKFMPPEDSGNCPVCRMAVRLREVKRMSRR